MELTDRELLERAAKAAGIPITIGKDWHDEGQIYAYNVTVWNPLTDDGDALRLAAKLKIDVEWQATSIHPCAEVEAYRRDDHAGMFYCASEHENDYRRAIVRAAAAIGEGM